MNWKFKLKKFFSFYRNKSSVWIKVIQTDGVEYICEANINDIDKEINSIKPFAKSIKIC